MKQPDVSRQLIRGLRTLLLLMLLLGIGLFYLGRMLFLPYTKVPEQSRTHTESMPPLPAETFWTAPDAAQIDDSALKSLVLYGKELVVHTAQYLGPKGSVAAISNGLNCQNCHLDAGTKVFGNNYGSVASTYPKFRARSGSMEDIHIRVNDCFERSLNGKALDTNSREMQAIQAYIRFLGKEVPKGKKAAGSGLKELAYLDRAADPQRGRIAYAQRCASCHGADGNGIWNASARIYTYPPLWGLHSYNDAAGLYRLSNFARFIKYNMPLGVNHQSAQLSDEAAWDIAAYVNAQARPHKAFPKDWPDVSKKPIDHPFGPYGDSYSETQHKYGPFKPIAAAAKK